MKVRPFKEKKLGVGSACDPHRFDASPDSSGSGPESK
jgi:hypothetical protein